MPTNRPPDVDLDLESTDEEEEQPLHVARRAATRVRARAVTDDDDEEFPAAPSERAFRFPAASAQAPAVHETRGPSNTMRTALPVQTTPRFPVAGLSGEDFIHT